MSVTRHHADWLSLIESSGPFVSLPVLMRFFPQGLEPRDPAQAKALRSAYEEWHDNPGAPGKQRAWLLYVLTAVLGYPLEQITEGQSMPAGLETSMPEMGETLRPDYALVGPAGSDSTGKPQLLIASYPHTQGLDKPVIGKHWKATPATRMMELLHGANVSLGLVSNGEQWMLVYAPRGETTGYTSWYSSLWLDEPITLRAFHSLLGVRRFFGVAADSTLLALLKESASDQQEVTDQLGYQVREAVEVLVQSFDALDRESGRILLTGVTETKLYEAALTIMMRLVFLFSAEERGLLHLGKPLYDDNYAVSTLQEQLQEVADRYGEEVLERRFDAWARLLATFRAVHGGVQHQDLLMQAYGGSLFDPDRYPFLEGRPAGTTWHTAISEPLTVNNRVVLHLLNSLQRLRTKVGTGTTTETRRVSFRALGVEQIGHVYEGLLDHTAVRASEPVLGVRGTRTKEPEIPLSVLETKLAEGQDKLIEFLKDETGRSVNAIRREFEGGGLLDEHKLLVACDHDDQLVARLRPFAGLIREDSFDRPLVILTESVYVTAGTDRRSSGTHYTPPSLTEPVVQHTLEPLVYEGPGKGWPREQWKLKPPKGILDLKVCDMAMGSGAFLVQACRYLAERLVEAWENEEKVNPEKVLITPDGKFSDGSPSERLVPIDSNERIAIARRVIADRCLYGVDINPMAVEMAKLSLWLITVDANRPFTFLDHAFKCGDSLLGITSFVQLENFSMRPDSSKQLGFATLDLRQYIEKSKLKREALEAMPSDTPEQILAKSELYAEAEDAVAGLYAVGDALIALELKNLKSGSYESEREEIANQLMQFWDKGIDELQNYANKSMAGRQCLHWILAYPEVIGKGGFDAFLGNPPFLGGSKITNFTGTEYRDYLLRVIAGGRKGKADLSVYFVLRAYELLLNGNIGFVVTSSIAEGDSREVGLNHLISNGASLFRAEPNAIWPGQATVSIAKIWLSTSWNGKVLIDDKEVDRILPSLVSSSDLKLPPVPLIANANSYFRGTEIKGLGFVLEKEEASILLKDTVNSQIIFPYLTGSDLNSTVDQSATRYVINFHDWSLEKSEKFTECFSIVTERVKPYRDTITKQIHEADYWKFWDKRLSNYNKISKLPRIIAISLVTNHVSFAFLPSNGIVYSHKVAIISSSDSAVFGVLQSCFQYCWAWEYSPRNLSLLAYSPAECVAKFPFPSSTTLSSDTFNVNDNSEILRATGEKYNTLRSILMNKTGFGLTDFYNKLHSEDISTDEIIEFRHMQIELDKCVAAAYMWQDIDLDHNFHETKQGIRFTISEAARREVLDRLLSLNHQRHAEEEAELASQPVVSAKKRSKKVKISDDQMMMDL